MYDATALDACVHTRTRMHEPNAKPCYITKKTHLHAICTLSRNAYDIVARPRVYECMYIYLSVSVLCTYVYVYARTIRNRRLS